MKNKFVDFKVLATSLCCSVVMGLISFAFLKCLDYAADFRSFFPLCYIFLPVAGIVTAFVYKRIGGKSSMGNNIIIESANDGEKVPKRLASLTFIFTCITEPNAELTLRCPGDGCPDRCPAPAPRTPGPAAGPWGCRAGCCSPFSGGRADSGRGRASRR